MTKVQTPTQDVPSCGPIEDVAQTCPEAVSLHRQPPGQLFYPELRSKAGVAIRARSGFGSLICPTTSYMTLGKSLSLSELYFPLV